MMLLPYYLISYLHTLISLTLRYCRVKRKNVLSTFIHAGASAVFLRMTMCSSQLILHVGLQVVQVDSEERALAHIGVLFLITPSLLSAINWHRQSGLAAHF